MVTPSYTWRGALHPMDLDADGHDAAEHVTYDNGSSGLTATDVQAAIDEVAGGASISDILDLPTVETDTSLVLAPDGAGGVEFRAETGGGGGGSFTSYETLITGMSGLVHRWKFEEASGNFADSVGSLTLTKSGTVTYSVSGGPVSGGSGSITLGGSARGLSSGLGSLPTGGSARTVVTIYKGKAAGAANQWVWDYGTHNTRQAFAFIINSSTTNDRTGAIVWADDLEMSSSGCQVATWHMHAMLYDGTQTTGLFFDGQYFGHTLGAALNTATGGNFSLGQDVNGSGQTGAITLDDLAVFNRALQPYELMQLYNALVGALP